MPWEIRYKCDGVDWSVPVQEQWPVYRPISRTLPELLAAVETIVDRHDPKLITIYKDDPNETEPKP